jgi:hypothetical protein
LEEKLSKKFDKPESDTQSIKPRVDTASLPIKTVDSHSGFCPACQGEKRVAKRKVCLEEHFGIAIPVEVDSEAPCMVCRDSRTNAPRGYVESCRLCVTKRHWTCTCDCRSLSADEIKAAIVEYESAEPDERRRIAKMSQIQHISVDERIKHPYHRNYGDGKKGRGSSITISHNSRNLVNSRKPNECF